MNIPIPRSIEALNEELLAIKMEMAFVELIAQETDVLQREIDDAPEYIKMAYAPTDEQYAKFMKMVDRALRQGKMKRFITKQLPQIGRAAAAVLLVFFLSLSTALAVSSTVRVSVMALIMKVEEEYIQISIEENVDLSFEIPADWPMRIYPRFLPDGFGLGDVVITDSYSIASFNHEDGRRVILTENQESSVTNVDAEDAEISEVSLRGISVTCIRLEDEISCIWQEGQFYYTLNIDGSYMEAISIFEGMMIVN